LVAFKPHAMSTLNNASQIINISLKFREFNRLPSLIWKAQDGLQGGGQIGPPHRYNGFSLWRPPQTSPCNAARNRGIDRW
jgi:hypothetical protein